MIELISPSLCTGCNICVRVCPVNVFEAVPGGIPTMPRQSSCQTCFMCEAWCPEDAMYVSPNADELGQADEAQLTSQGLLGGYRQSIGWNRSATHLRGQDDSYRLVSLPSPK